MPNLILYQCQIRHLAEGVDCGWWMVNHDVYILSGKGVDPQQLKAIENLHNFYTRLN
jgi:hypothetical protein